MAVRPYFCTCVLFLGFASQAWATGAHERAKAKPLGTSTLAISTPSAPAKNLFEKGMADFLNQKTEQALESWRAAASSDPNCAVLPAFISFSTSDPNEERRSRDAAKRLGGCLSPGEKLLSRWIINTREDNYVLGIAAMNDLLAMYPKDKRLLYIAGHWLLDQQSYDLSQSLLQRALAQDAHLPAALNDLGRIYAALGDFPNAFATMERSVSVLPKDPVPQHSYAEILRRGGNFEAALEHDRAALKLDANFPLAHLGMGDTYAFMGEEETARKEYALAMRGARDERQRIQESLQSALTYVRETKYHKANTALEAIALHARDAHLPLLEAEAYRYAAAYQSSDQDALRYAGLADAVLDGKQGFSGADLAEEQARILELRAIRGASAARTDVSNDALEQLSRLANRSRSANIQRAYDAALGSVLVLEHKELEAIPHLQEDDRNPRSMQQLVVAYNQTGAPDKAHALEMKIAAINEPTLEQALVVPELRARLAGRDQTKELAVEDCAALTNRLSSAWGFRLDCKWRLMRNVLAIRKAWRRALCSRGESAFLIVAAFCAFVIAAAPVARASDIAVVVNKNVNLQSVTTSDLVKICKGDLNHWPDGQALTLVILDPELPAMKVVNEKIYKLSAAEVRALFTGTNRTTANRHSMIIVASPDELVRLVASKPGAIGLVDVYSITGAVSVTKIDDKLPLQSGYCLHGN